MKWEYLSVSEFKESINKTKGVAIIPIGCLEKHGYHMPLGTDMFIAKTIAEKAAEKEEALVVPIAPYGIISEAQHRYGCLSISSKLQYELLEEVCDQLARNGYKKIIILNGHGGANNFMNYFAQSRLEKYHPYIVYVYKAHYRTLKQHQDFLKEYGPLNGSGHADMMETSEIMYMHPETVDLSKIDVSQCAPELRNEFLAENGIFTAIGWYGNHPHHIAGDPSNASAIKGEVLTNMYIDNLAKSIKIIKEDDVSLKLQEEFYKMMENPQE